MTIFRRLSACLRPRTLAAGLVVLQLSGCAWFRHDPGQVAIINPQQAQLSQVIHLASDQWPDSCWWQKYQDPQLTALIHQALQNSPTVQAARLRVEQSQAGVDLAHSFSGVQATAVAAQNRLRTTDRSFTWPYSFSLPQDRTGPWYTMNTVGVAGTLNLDLWGKTVSGWLPHWAKKCAVGGNRADRTDGSRQCRSALFFGTGRLATY